MAKKKPQKPKIKAKFKKPKKAKAKPKLAKESKSKPKPETRKDISANLNHLRGVAKELVIDCGIYHDDDMGGYVVSLSETSEDRSFATAEEAEEFLHEHEQE